MLNTRIRHQLMWVAGAALGLAVLTIAGCAASPKAENSSAAPAKDEMASAAPAKTGIQLWSENCGMCHNVRDPGEFSDAQWTVIVNHMRLQRDLNGKDAKAIEDFLKASN